MSARWRLILQGARARLGLTQVELAAALGVAPATIERWESVLGLDAPRAPHMVRLALAALLEDLDPYNPDGGAEPGPQ